MTVHGAIMLAGGLAFGFAVVRARVLPPWTGVCLMIGVVLVASASGFPNIARTIAAAGPDAAFIGMGVALLSRISYSSEVVHPPRDREPAAPGLIRTYGLGSSVDWSVSHMLIDAQCDAGWLGAP
jgi:hypothetical protein